jgi:D-serine deaminase-like pyridoxal phosphate-dependent protein
MSIEGRIAIDVNFADSSDSTGVQSLKKISLVDTDSYSTGKVALLTGTCGTDVVTLVNDGVTTYKDASGSAVTFTTLSRCAAQVVGTNVIVYDNFSTLICKGGAVCVFEPSSKTVTVNTVSGTASYTVVVYGT